MDEERRHHEVGQALLEALPQRVVAVEAQVRDHVRDEALVDTFARGRDDDVVHAVVRPDRGLDLPEFDAVAADLDLEVVASEVEERPVRGVADQIAGAVEARAELRADAVRDEALAGELRTLEVAARHSGTTDEELARDAEGHGLAGRVEDEEDVLGSGFPMVTR